MFLLKNYLMTENDSGSIGAAVGVTNLVKKLVQNDFGFALFDVVLSHLQCTDCLGQFCEVEGGRVFDVISILVAFLHVDAADCDRSFVGFNVVSEDGCTDVADAENLFWWVAVASSGTFLSHWFNLSVE